MSMNGIGSDSGSSSLDLLNVTALVCDPGKQEEKSSISTPLVAMGTLLVLGASFISCFGVNLQKLAHNKNTARVLEERKNMYLMWQWWLGIIAMVMGSVMDMAALPFVPLSRVAALGASTMVANIIITPLFLKETLTKHDLCGCALAVAGTVIACLFGAGKEHAVSSPCLLSYFSAPLFVLYATVVTILLAFLYYHIICFKKKQRAMVNAGIIEDTLECVWLHYNLDKLEGIPNEKYCTFVTSWGPQFYPTVHAVYAGTIGAQSVMFAKTVLKFLGNAVYETDGSTASSVGYIFVFLVPTAFCLVNQIHYLNVSLQIYRDALFVLPVYQAMWVAAGILSGLFFYQEYREIRHLDAILFTLGCLLSMTGLVVLAKRKSQTDPILQSPRTSRTDAAGSPTLMSARSDQDTEGYTVEMEMDRPTPTKRVKHQGKGEYVSLTSPMEMLPEEANWIGNASMSTPPEQGLYNVMPHDSSETQNSNMTSGDMPSPINLQEGDMEMKEMQ